MVLDRQPGPGLETSFANAALLTPSMSDPWNAPGVWRILLASIGRSDAPMQLRLPALPRLARWGVTFLRNSNREAFQRNRLANLRLGLHSLKLMPELRHQTSLQYNHSTVGTLRTFRDLTRLNHAYAAAKQLAAEGLSCRRLTPAEMVKIEPALAPIAAQLAGAIHHEMEENGDAHRFCVELADHDRTTGVEFRFDTEVQSLEARSGRMIAVHTTAGKFIADRYVVAAGSYSTDLLESAGVYLPVQPVKGYSVTFKGAGGPGSLTTPVVDDHLHAVVVPIGNDIRVAGIAEFAGYDRSLSPRRIRNLIGLLNQILPHERLDLAAAIPWCGLRPVSADGTPIIGQTGVENLLVNTGQGHLGWTLAAGSAHLLADIVSGTTPSLDPTPYALSRFV
jgi:D-amino-acid dehydrogenase